MDLITLMRQEQEAKIAKSLGYAPKGQQRTTAKPAAKPTAKQDFQIKGLNISARSYSEAADIAAELLTGCRDAAELNEICSRAVSNYPIVHRGKK